MKFIALSSAIFMSAIAFAESSSGGFGEYRPPSASEQPATSPNASLADQAPAVSDALDPIRMQFDELRTKYEKDSALVVKPVAEGYVRQLEALETQLSNKRRFEDAEIVKKYVDYIKAKYIDQAMDVPQMPDISKIKELVELQKQFATYSLKAVKPVADAYIKKLDAESVKCARDKDYKNAKRFQEEIKRVNDYFASGGNVQPAVNPFVGKWKVGDDGNLSREILPNGVVIVYAGDQVFDRRTWKMNGDTWEEYSAEGLCYHRVKMINPDMAIADTAGRDNNQLTFTRVVNPAEMAKLFVGKWQCIDHQWGRMIFPNGMVFCFDGNKRGGDRRWKLNGSVLEAYLIDGSLAEKMTIIDNQTLILEDCKYSGNLKFTYKRMK